VFRGVARSLWLAIERRRAVARLRTASLGAGRGHGLQSSLTLSLTSFPARFPSLHLTLRSLLAQSVRPDRTLLWIAQDDIARIPQEVRALEAFGLEIRACADVRSYKKLIPALEAYPDDFIVTADDDVYYPPDWLEALVAAVGEKDGTVICHRAHRLVRQADGKIAPYAKWGHDVADAAARTASTDLLPTGVGGVLYPPASLDPMVLDRALFSRLCPDGDDLWFYWCARKQGTRHKKVGGKFRQISWESTQDFALWNDNEAGGNDEMVDALEREFGSFG
jgi:hypothetical protein